MNIGIVTTWFERGAAYVSRQYRDLLSQEDNVFIYARGGEESSRGDDRWDDESVTYARQIGPRLPTWIDRTEFLRWIEARSLETVFFNEQHFWLPLLWCRAAGVKTGAYIDYYTESTIPLFAAYDFLICNTKRHSSAFDWHEQCYFIPWGTQLDVFKPQKLEAVEDGMVIFFHSAGVSPRRKGTDEAIKAFERIQGAAKLIVHTQVPLTKELPEIASLIGKLEQNARLYVIEKTVPAPGLYASGDVYVYPSRLEGIGLTIAEALACGLPVIVPDQAPMNEFVDADLKNGTLVDVDRLYARSDGYYWPQCRIDTASLQQAMQEYVDSAADLPNRKRSAFEYAKTRLDWKSRAGLIRTAFHESRILETEKKAHALDDITVKSRAQYGRKLDLWVKYPRFCSLARDIAGAVRFLVRPILKAVLKRIG